MSQRRKASCLVALRIGEREAMGEREREANLLIPMGDGRGRGAQIGGQISTVRRIRYRARLMSVP